METESQFPMGTFTKKRFSMFKGNIIDSTAVATRQPKRTVAILIEAFLDCIERGLARDGIARLRGFGSFYVRMRKARSVRNPRTGEALVIPARKVVRFRAGEKLRKRIR